MNTHSINPEQLEKLVEALDSEFKNFLSGNKSNVSSFKNCFYIPDMYKEQKLYALKENVLEEFPEEIKQKAHNMIAEFSSVD